METNSVKVEIFGQTYTINGDASPEHISRLADYINDKMMEISSGITNTNPQQVAILAALNIADEYFQLKKIKAGSEEAVGEKARMLVSMLDDGLIGDFIQKMA
jgi:cell division protein ZapA